MKRILPYSVFILLTGLISFSSCKKENLVSPVVTPIVTPTPPQDMNLQLVLFGTLSQARFYMLAATAYNKVLFVGGRYLVRNCFYDSTDNAWWNCEISSTRVDIYDTSTHNWSTAELNGSEYSNWNCAATIGNKIFLSGGYPNSGRVDVYDAASNSWSTIEIPVARWNGVAAVSLGNKIYFAGGFERGRVDIYDNSTNSWSTANLSDTRSILTGTSVGNKILFAGGNSGSSPSATVDIYDASTNNWSTGALSQASEHPISITLGNKAFFIAGNVGFAQNFTPVDMYDNTSKTWSNTHLPLGGWSTEAVAVHNKILYFRYSSQVDVYDDFSNSWSVVKLNHRTGNAAVIAVGNKVYVAGGNPDNGVQDQTNQVWTLEF